MVYNRNVLSENNISINDFQLINNFIMEVRRKGLFVRRKVIKILERAGDPQVFYLALIYLKDPDRFIRYYAVETLGNLGNHLAIEPLIDALLDPYPPIVDAAAEALKKIDHPRTIGLLIERARNKDEAIRRSAAIGLGTIIDPRIINSLLKGFEPMKPFREPSWTA